MKLNEADSENWSLDHLIDIYKVATDSVVFPTYGNGLKKIAPYIGFQLET